MLILQSWQIRLPRLLLSSVTMKRKFILVIILLFCSAFLSAQIRIDWQQCYGSMETDEVRCIIPNETGGYRVAGYVGEESGMVGCSFENVNRCWLIEIDSFGGFIGENCISKFYPSKMFRLGESSFYMAGVGNRYIYYDRFIEVRKYRDEGTLEWRTQAGNDEKGVGNPPRVALTSDGGVVATSFVQWPCGPGGEYYGGADAWVVKINSEGEQEWEIMLGSQGEELPLAVLGDSEGNTLVSITGSPLGYGNVASCNRTKHDAIITKLNSLGEIIWSRCYGGEEADGFNNFTELSDGYLFAGITESDDGDLDGAGYHFGYPNGNQWFRYSRDIWLMKTDFDGNVLWSRCYGGTEDDYPVEVFQNEDGGFTVFGTSKSIDGDVQSGQNLHLPWNGSPSKKIWAFRTDADGNLLWERAIGHKGNDIDLSDVIKHNEKEYTLAATSGACVDPEYQGDYNCTNAPLLEHGYKNWWVLHITDIFNYDDPTGIEEQPKVVPFTAKVYPNPTSNYLVVNGEKLQSADVYSLLGELVASKLGENVANITIDMNELPAGVYFVKVRDTEGRMCVQKIVKR